MRIRPTIQSALPVGPPLGRVRLSLFARGAAVLGLLAAPALAETADICKEPKTGTKEIPIFSPPLSNVVTGTGRLQFYSAPNLGCPKHGVFVIPNDQLITYAQTSDGRSSVMFVNPSAGNTVSGWVRSARLKDTGRIGPRQ